MKSRKFKRNPRFLMKGLIFLILNFCCVQYAVGANLDVQFGNLNLRKEVKSLKDLRYTTMVRQTRDYSCGAAALATILTHYFGEETTEEQVLGTILEHADEEAVERIRKEGVTLLDLKLYADSRGYEGAGYKIEVQDLQLLDRPAIALVDYGYHHFVVLKGIAEGRVHMADPAKGNLVKSLKEFQDMWNGVILVFKNSNGPRIKDHELVIKSGIPKDKIGLLPDLLDVGFAARSSEF